MANNVTIHNEVPKRTEEDSWWTLHFQYCTYNYDDGSDPENGYRFIWRRPDGSLQAARGQARIPDKKAMFELFAKASEEGWF